jgi:nitrogen regulatory protein PII
MIKIEAVIKPFKLDDVKDALIAVRTGEHGSAVI